MNLVQKQASSPQFRVAENLMACEHVSRAGIPLGTRHILHKER